MNEETMNIDRCEENTCFFTGHRTIAQEELASVKDSVRRQIFQHISKGYVNFMCGGAMGFDTVAAIEVLRIKAGGAPIRLVLALPCRDQTSSWKDLEMIRLYQRIKGAADEVIYVSDLYFDGCMKLRNQFMVDSSTACIAYYNGFPRSGTGQTVRMAEGKKLTVANIFERKE